MNRTLPILLLLAALLTGGLWFRQQGETAQRTEEASPLWVEMENGVPSFTQEDLLLEGAVYSPLDSLGRCGPAMARLGVETMPTEPRGAIGMVRPSGWQLVKYDFVDGKYLYNRCHLIAYQLSGENANVQNLITGTRCLNVEGMLPFENETAEYLRSTGNHVLYRVTPRFLGNELLARGVEMEALSLEDGGAGLCFHVFVYNRQPGVEIDYATGESWLPDQTPIEEEPTERALPEVWQEPEAAQAPGETEPPPSLQPPQAGEDYVLNTRSRKFHLPDCQGVSDMSEKNKQLYHGPREALLEQGYQPCQWCKP